MHIKVFTQISDYVIAFIINGKQSEMLTFVDQRYLYSVELMVIVTLRILCKSERRNLESKVIKEETYFTVMSWKMTPLT